MSGPVPRELVLATGNAGKLAEIRAMLAGLHWRVRPQSDFGIETPPEDGDTFLANALIKARHAARVSGLPAIADDSGLEVDALGGRPGIHSARYAGPGCSSADNNRRLLAELAGIAPPSRGARFRCTVVLVRGPDDLAPLVAEGCWEGAIAQAPRGHGGFGYDPLFVPVGGALTVAELPAAAKNRASHRGQALRRLVETLRSG